MAKYQRYAGYAHEAPDPIIPKPDVPQDPMILLLTSRWLTHPFFGLSGQFR